MSQFVEIPAEVPTEVPRLGNGITSTIGKLLIKLTGWRMDGEIPAEKKVMIALAPHTSNWDFIVAMPFILALGIKISWLMKKEAFFFPFKKLFMWLGGLPTDRRSAGNLALHVASSFRENEKMWVGITPEGTRKKVGHWKNGFLRIAYAADVPILLIAWDFPNKRMCIDSLYHPTGDLKQDMAEIQTRFNKYRGYHHDIKGGFDGGNESTRDTAK
ncbi:1-acyl-sn-glycerol-3-phosphate acyltransferase [Microbulbifer sp. OS29]|uniref:1-acyl-sn-glycerol-3-phosphate acyltransferase n=1 Tax=Microbulbifer okhotskensis TaxID=2926617 RepID=A0A9X2J7H8_9GAMM|nr:1-acyl-sn-glycerol-3-phosphate acyltransferase [Microbulbifer okhotskensis]MCO1336614.1 1-acyl-sn-glycerol-3-phosphate acyltransferase [Microbulbifer okhotskensis]